ncbi:pentapeptide repeat-containing protein [Calothrix rhizosoleniae]|uniref:pentapeptide repeat-containing protein n=1 Tax=Calothrix rhizosoleniae TaxID=888997 RepID=UPI001F3B9870|nr:pentapeptide repeat-containing protein [Calothrix rhizosoleniae]
MQVNPYIIGRPIRSRESQFFFGREELFQFIKDNLLQGKGGKGGKVILLHGQRRIGKTSLLLQIPKALPLEDFIFVQFDLQGRENQSLGCILEELAEAITVGCKIEDEINLPERKELENNQFIFASQFLSQVYPALKDRNLVLLLDEFDVLDHRSRKVGANQFFHFLQQIVEGQEKLFIIPVVGRRLDELENFRLLFKSAPHRKIGLLDKDSAQQLITKPAKGKLVYSEDGIQAILELSSGHPYCTQLLCHAIFSRARDKGLSLVKRNDVKAVIDKAIESGEAGLTWFWDGLPDIERLVFSAIAEAQERGINGESWALLQEYGVVQQEPLLKAEQALLTSGFLQTSTIAEWGPYKVTIELVRLWLVKQHPLRQTLVLFLDMENPSLPALVQRAKSLKAQQEAQVLDPQQVWSLFVGKRFEILKILLSSLEEIFTSDLQLTSTTKKILMLYTQKTRQQQFLEACVAWVGQIAYLASFKAILNLLEEWERQALLQQIGQIKFFQFLERQSNLLNKNAWKLNKHEAEKVLFCFHESNLAQNLKLALTEQLQKFGFSELKLETLSERVTLGTHQYIMQFLAEEGDVAKDFANQWVLAISAQVWERQKKHYQDQLAWENLQTEEKIHEFSRKENLKYQKISEYLYKQSQDNPSDEYFTFKDINIPIKAKYADIDGRQEFYLQDWAIEALADPNKQDQVLFVQGEPGQGRSLFCHIFANWIRQNWHPILTPIWIKLQDIRALEYNFAKTLQTALSKWEFANNDDHWLKDKNTRFLFLLDCLDELITERQIEQGLEAFLQQVGEFQRVCQLNHEEAGHRVLLIGSFSALQVLGLPLIYERIIPNLERVQIQPLDRELQQKWLEQWGKLKGVGADEAGKFEQFLNNRRELQSLIKERLLLFLLAAMHHDRELEDIEEIFNQGISPEEAKIQIYEKFLDWVLQNQLPNTVTKALLGKNKGNLTTAQKNYLKRILQEAGLCAIQSGGIRAAIIMVEERLKNKGIALELIQKLQKLQKAKTYSTNLANFSIQPNSESRGKIQFNHKSFSEFLYARRLQESLINWTQKWPERQEYLIPVNRMDWEIYDLLGFGGLTLEIVGYLRALLRKSQKFDSVSLFTRLEDFYFRWVKGEFINNVFSETLAQRKMHQLQKPLETQGLFFGQRQIDIYTGLNIFILLLELHRNSTQISFYPCGKISKNCADENQSSLESRHLISETEPFDPYRLLRLISYSRCLGAEVFVKTVGPFLAEINLRGADLHGAELYGVKLTKAYLSGAKLNGINLSSANLNRAFLGNAKLCRANLSDANLSHAFLGNADLTGAFLGSANLQNAVLTGTNLRTALLGNANLQDAHLGDADLSDANLHNADLSGTNLSCATLDYANLIGVNLEGANLRGTSLKDIHWDRNTKWEPQEVKKASSVPNKLKRELKIT